VVGFRIGKNYGEKIGAVGNKNSGFFIRGSSVIRLRGKPTPARFVCPAGFLYGWEKTRSGIGPGHEQ
jgi:hypothetical protein